jgi:hypothetical protein
LQQQNPGALGLFDEDVKPKNVSICDVSTLDTDVILVPKNLGSTITPYLCQSGQKKNSKGDFIEYDVITRPGK